MIGQTVGHYRIESKLGEGGMGVVYKGRDTHLDRFVALKVLPPEKVADPERKRRFVQEAKAACALNHPNIVHIYDIAETGPEEGSVQFIVMEFVSGKTLDHLIGRKGLRLGEALKYAIQIADALARAHAANIVHRDLKPSNVMVDERGLVKVLDFGLAKLVERGAGEFMPTETLHVKPEGKTEEGIIMGTVAYMSPEQAEAKPVDARSDIFSFGAVLYEMLTGRRAFHGDSKVATLSAILHEEPAPLSTAGDGVPVDVEKLIARCLRKDPERRLQHMGDLKLALEELKAESESGRLAVEQLPAKPRGRRLVAAKLAVGVAALGIVAGTTYFLLRPRAESASPVKDISFTKLTDQAGLETFPSLSPDGRSFVYAASGSGNWDIYLQRVGGKNPINLTKDSPADHTEPAFSPDGDRIAFRSERNGGGLFVMGATGESVRRLTDFGYNPAWSPDGKEIVFGVARADDPAGRYAFDSQLWVVNTSSGEKRQLTRPETVPDAVQPNWSPHGHRITYWAVRGGQRDIWTMAADGAHPVAVTDDAALDWSPVWSPDGNYLYFASDRGGSMNLWRVAIDERSGKVRGRPTPVTTPSPYSGPISLSRDGKRLAYVQQLTTANIQKASFDPVKEALVSEPQWVTQGSRQARDPQLSPDGEWLVYWEGGKQEDVFIVKTDGTGLQQLTNDVYKDRYPRWSPDGKRIAFHSNRAGKHEIWVINPDGSGLERLTYEQAPAVYFPIWSPDGRSLIYTIPSAKRSFVMDVTKPWKEQSPKPVLALPAQRNWFYVLSWSPDGRKLGGSLRKPDGSGSGMGIYFLEPEKLEQLTASGDRPAWLGDSRRVLLPDRGRLYLIDIESRKKHELLSVAPNGLDTPTLSRDNRQMYFSVVVTEADIWLANIE